jgi:hypothetical protein
VGEQLVVLVAVAAMGKNQQSGGEHDQKPEPLAAWRPQTSGERESASGLNTQ